MPLKYSATQYEQIQNYLLLPDPQSTENLTLDFGVY